MYSISLLIRTESIDMMKWFWDDRSKDLSVVECMMAKAFTPLQTSNDKFRVGWNFCRENVIFFCLLLHERQKKAILWRWLNQYVWLGNNTTVRISAFTSFQFRPCAICFYFVCISFIIIILLNKLHLTGLVVGILSITRCTALCKGDERDPQRKYRFKLTWMTILVNMEI